MKIHSLFINFGWVLLGSAVGFTGLMGYLGWSLTAFLAMGIWSVVPAIYIGLLLFLLLVVILQRVLPLLIHFTVTKIVESNIRSALREKGEDKSNLKKWLAIAHDGNFDQDCWRYEFRTGQSLVELGLTESDHHYERSQRSGFFQIAYFKRQHLFTSQDYVAGVVYAYKASRKSGAKFELRWYHRLLIRFKHIGNVNWQFKSTVNQSEVIKNSIKNFRGIYHGANEPTTGLKLNTDSLRHTETTDEVIDGLFREDPAMVLPKDCEEMHATHAPTVLSHLKHWLKQREINQDQKQEQEQVFDQQQEQQQVTDLESTLQAERTSARWVDDSKRMNINQFKQACHTEGSRWYDETQDQWIEKLTAYVWEKKKKWLTRISVNAKDLIVSNSELYKSDDHNNSLVFNLDTLTSAGLVLQEDESGEEIELIYNQEYKKQEQKNLLSCYVSDKDTKDSDKKTPNFPFIPPGKLIELLSSRGIILSKEVQVQLINMEKRSKTEEGKTLYYMHLTKFFAFIYEIAKKEKPNLVVAIIEKMIAYDNKKFRRLNHIKFEKNEDTTLLSTLMLFLLDYHGFEYALRDLDGDLLLPLDNSGGDFSMRHDIGEIQDLLTLTDLTEREMIYLDILLSGWFDMHQKTSLGSFSKCLRQFHFFVSFFKQKNIHLPDPAIIFSNTEKVFPVLLLKLIIDCIELSKNHAMQLKYIEAMCSDCNDRRPDAMFIRKVFNYNDFSLVREMLRSGYKIVHKEMGLHFRFFDKPLSQEFSKLGIQNEFMISEVELRIMSGIENLQLESNLKMRVYKTVFFRYLGLNATAEDAIKGFELWDQLIKKDSDIATNWDRLKEYALQVSCTLAVTPDQKESKEKTPTLGFANEEHAAKALAKKQYQSDDVEALFKKMKLDLKDAKQLKADIEEMNGCLDHYSKLNPEKLAELLRNAKSDLHNKKINLPACLALLREAHYRLSGYKEWLRLEQAVVVLFALQKNRLFQVDTSDGKTLIIRLLAFMKALQGKKTDVITHSENFAEEGSHKAQALASLLGLKVAKQRDAVERVLQADVLYVDISTAVLSDRMAKFSKREEEKKTVNQPLRGDRKADFALVDEVDAVVIDMHSSTTMQISRAAAVADKKLLEDFLILLNHVVRAQLPSEDKLTEPEQQREFVRNKLKNDPYYIKQNMDKHPIILDRWISAAITAMSLKLKEDYIIEKPQDSKAEFVRIVHKDTSGDVDKISQWGQGVHQCVAAWEKQQGHSAIQIPGISVVIAEGDIASYLNRHYCSRCGFTGTLGNHAVQKQMQAILRTEGTVIMPRAKREAPENVHWPLVSKKDLDKEGDEKASEEEDEKAYEEQYKRLFLFPPQFLNNNDYFETFLKAIRSAQRKNYSIIIFWNTIKQCEEFSDFLRVNGISLNELQVMDDSPDTEEGVLRPPRETVIQQAKRPRMITLTTPKGSRGVDFDDINLGIVATQSLDRVFWQKISRLGRNGQRGVVYQLYHETDVPEIPSQSTPPSPQEAPEQEKTELKVSHDFRARCEFWANSKQQADLDIIQQREALREFKQELQEKFIEEMANASDKEKLASAWANFFGTIDLYWQSDKAVPQQNALAEQWAQAFQGTSWPSLALSDLAPADYCMASL